MEECPAPTDEPIVEVAVALEETPEAPEVATVVAKSSRPRLPVIFYRLMAKPRLKAVEQYIASFEYSLHPQTNFNTQKQRPLFLIMETAKQIITAPQPIKCVEAVFVALLLTAGLPDVERYPLSFQTVLDDQVDKVLLNIKICMILLDHRMRGIHQAAQVYQHIVLLVQHFNKFGAIGISRWPEFCSKGLKFLSMSSVIEDYKTAYQEQHHVVEKIRVGLPVEHNTRSTNFVCWRHLELDLNDRPWRDCVEAIDEFAAKSKQLLNSWIRSGRGEDPRRVYIRQTKRMLADRESSPYKAKTLKTGIVHSKLNVENCDFMDVGVVNCRFSIQPPSSKDSARIALSLEPGEVSYFWKKTKTPGSTMPKEFCLENKSIRSPSKQGFSSKCRRCKKLFKSGSPQIGARAVQLAKGAIKSLPRAVAPSENAEPPLVVSQCILGNKFLNPAPGFDGQRASWECLRTLYRTKNEARLLLLKDKLADLRMQGPSRDEAYHVVQDLFQQLVGIGEAITSKLDVYERTINTLAENFDVVVQSANNLNDLHSLKQLTKELAEESSTEDEVKIKKKKAVTTIESLKKMEPQPHVHYRVPPCNWCGNHGHRMRECQDLEVEIARRVREYKLRAPKVEEPKSLSVEEPVKVQEQTEVKKVKAPKEKRSSKMSVKKRLVQRRLQTKLMYLLGK